MMSITPKIAIAVLLSIILAHIANAEVTTEQEAAAMELLAKNGIEADGQYHITRYLAYKNGGGVISVQQLHDGLIVFDSELAFHFIDGGELVRAQDGSSNLMGIRQDVDDLVVNRDELLPPQDAVEAFAERSKQITVPNITGTGPGNVVAGPKCTQDPESVDATLGIFKQTVVWQLKCEKRRNPLMYMDAVTGSILFFDSGIRS
jgi:hypothetical protein